MAEAVVSAALETLKDLLLEEGKFLSGVGDKVKVIQAQLKEIKCLLEDADRRRHESRSVRNWIAEIRDVAYRAEDVIASYAVRMSSDARGGGVKRLLHKFARNLTGCRSLHQLGSDISDIKSELAKVTKKMQDYGIKSIIDEWKAQSNVTDNKNWANTTFPNFEIEECFVGKEDELKRVESLLVDNKQHRRVISLWGMGGIGKTTIAKKVFIQMIEAKDRRFDSFAWVCITRQCQIRSVFEDVLKQLVSQKEENLSIVNHTHENGRTSRV